MNYLNIQGWLNMGAAVADDSQFAPAHVLGRYYLTYVFALNDRRIHGNASEKGEGGWT